VLYLDDLWSPQTPDKRWLPWALDIMEGEPEVEQVCLKRRIDTSDELAGRIFRQPFTFAPSLLRADQLETLLPPDGAKSRRWPLPRLKAEPPPSRLKTMRLSPGVFRRNDGLGPPGTSA